MEIPLLAVLCGRAKCYRSGLRKFTTQKFGRLQKIIQLIFYESRLCAGLVSTMFLRRSFNRFNGLSCRWRLVESLKITSRNPVWKFHFLRNIPTFPDHKNIRMSEIATCKERLKVYSSKLETKLTQISWHPCFSCIDKIDLFSIYFH